MTALDDVLLEIGARGLDAVFERMGDVKAATSRLARPFTDLVHDADPGPVILFGCGAWGRSTAARLAAAGRPATVFADNVAARWGQTVAGLPVLSPAEAVARFAHDGLFVTTIYNGSAARRQLAALGCKRVLGAREFHLGLPDTFLPYYQLDRPDAVFASRDTIRDVDALWSDDVSRRVFASRVSQAVGLPADPEEPIGVSNDCYFDRSLIAIDERDCVVDCGAFDGDTIRALTQLGGRAPRRIVALEPDPRNARALRAFVATLGDEWAARIEVIEGAASADCGTLAFDGLGTVAAQVGRGALNVRTLRLDTLGDRRPTFIKMDVEGHERDALLGASMLLRTRPPALAVSLYHRSDDLWRIPALIASSNPGYRLYLRCYAEDGWESVCYAIPSSRRLPSEGGR